MASPSSDSNIFTLSTASLKLNTAADIIPHIAPLVSSDTVTEIRLGGNTLGPEACAHLASILSKKSKLATANLADIFTSRLLSEIPPALSSLLTSLLPLHNLHTIDLSDNAFGLNTQAPLVEFLRHHVPLKHLFLNNNGLGPHAGVLIADALTALAARKHEARQEGREVPDLETVVCGRNRLESGSMAAWAQAFQAHRGVRVVKMVQNGIRQEGIAALLRDGLHSCEELRVLDLQDNTFTAVGASALADVVVRWPALEELGVSDCLLRGPGAGKVAKVLQAGSNPRLRVLRAQYNDFNIGTVQALLAAAKSGLPALSRVELNGNKFSEDDEAVASLRALLEERRDENAPDGEWGLDELDELEEESDEEEEEQESQSDDDEEEQDLKKDRLLHEADLAENAPVAPEKDADVDALADRLSKSSI